MNVVYIATWSTRHYEWVAVGDTEKGAEAALKSRWLDHCIETGADPKLIREYKDDISVRRCELGKGYRDDEGTLPE